MRSFFVLFTFFELEAKLLNNYKHQVEEIQSTGVYIVHQLPESFKLSGSFLASHFTPF